MHDDIRLCQVRGPVQGISVFQPARDSGKTGMARQESVAGLLEADVIIGRHGVEACHLVTLVEQAPGQVEANKSGAAGDKVSHLGACFGSSGRCRPPDAEIGKSQPSHILGTVDIPEIDKDPGGHCLAQPAEIKGAEGIPFGHDDKGMGACRRVIGILREMNIIEQAPRRRHAGRIIGPDNGALVLQGLDYGQGRGLPHVIGVGLEGEAEYGDRLATDISATGRNDLAGHSALALVIDGYSGFDQAERAAKVLGGFNKCKGILRKTGAAIAWSGMEEFGANAVVEANSAGNLLNINAGNFAEIGNLVDKAYLKGEKGICRIFDEFGAAPCGKQKWCLIEIKRPVNLGHDGAGPIIAEAYHDAVRFLEIADCRALAQKLRIGHHSHIGSRVDFADDALNLVSGSQWNCRLCGYHGETLECEGHFARNRIDIGKVGVPVTPAGRRSHGNEHNIGIANRGGEIG